MEFSFARSDRQVIDARDAPLHEAALVELPILVAIGAIPLARVIVPLIGEADSNAIAFAGPKLFDEPVVELLGPFASEELPDGFTAGQELGAVAPHAVGRIGE